MSLDGIDISGWQDGIDISKVPCDFVIVKATQGNSYVSKSYNAQVDGATRAGKLLGVYHYIDGSGAAAEMKHFHTTIKPVIGRAIICLDWEAEQNKAWGNVSYLEQCIKELKKLTDKAIFIYAGPYQNDVWSLASKYGCRTWKAHYANYNVMNGYQKPWNEGAYHCDIRQYSGNGRLPGFNGALDLNRAYLSASEWTELSGGTYTQAPEQPSTSGYDLYMQAISNGKVLPKVTNNNDNAGIDKPMQYLSAWTDPGKLKVQACNGAGKWLTALSNPNNINDKNLGAVGDGTTITKLRMYYYAPNSDKAVHYRVKTQKSGWLPWMIDNRDTGGSKDDFAGDGSPIYRVEAYIGGLS